MGRLEEAIRARAHAMWEEDGRPDGQAEEHWRRAAAEMGIPFDGDEEREEPVDRDDLPAAAGAADGAGGAAEPEAGNAPKAPAPGGPTISDKRAL